MSRFAVAAPSLLCVSLLCLPLGFGAVGAVTDPRLRVARGARDR